MARTWLSVRVKLVGRNGRDLWPRPGRIFAAARSHSFGQLADAINLAFARWDLAHLDVFTLADKTEITALDQWDGEAPDGSLDSHKTKLSRLSPGEQFAYVFDLGDNWAHLCTVATDRIDPLDQLGVVPTEPLPYFGWGDLPDQYGRRWDGDDGDLPAPKQPAQLLAELGSDVSRRRFAAQIPYRSSIRSVILRSWLAGVPAGPHTPGALQEHGERHRMPS